MTSIAYSLLAHAAAQEQAKRLAVLVNTTAEGTRLELAEANRLLRFEITILLGKAVGEGRATTEGIHSIVPDLFDITPGAYGNTPTAPASHEVEINEDTLYCVECGNHIPKGEEDYLDEGNPLCNGCLDKLSVERMNEEEDDAED